jgi:hypothetical protein
MIGTDEWRRTATMKPVIAMTIIDLLRRAGARIALSNLLLGLVGCSQTLAGAHDANKCLPALLVVPVLTLTTW